MNELKSITIYCASSRRVSEKFTRAAVKLAEVLVENNVEIIYGGGSGGLMGTIADTALKHGGKVKGIIPRFMVEVEWSHRNLTELVQVESMHQRKQMMIEKVDAVAALPGGSGTLDELMDTITLKRLGIFTKPIVIINTYGFYDPLIQQLQKCIDENFMDKKHSNIWRVIERPEEIIDAVKNSPPWQGSSLNFAVVK